MVRKVVLASVVLDRPKIFMLMRVPRLLSDRRQTEGRLKINALSLKVPSEEQLIGWTGSLLASSTKRGLNSTFYFLDKGLLKFLSKGVEL